MSKKCIVELCLTIHSSSQKIKYFIILCLCTSDTLFPSKLYHRPLILSSDNIFTVNSVFAPHLSLTITPPILVSTSSYKFFIIVCN